jgi:hypothetical protein
MAEIRESFPTTETAAGAGAPLAQAVNTVTDPAGLTGSIAFSFKDSLGKVVLPALDPEGRVPVTLEGVGVEKFATGFLAAGSATMVDITGASVALTPDKIHSQIVVTVSCFRDAIFNLVQIDDATTTILARFRVGPGQYSYTWNGHKKLVTAGSTGTQTLKVQGQNLNTQSEMDAEISFIELA